MMAVGVLWGGWARPEVTFQRRPKGTVASKQGTMGIQGNPMKTRKSVIPQGTAGRREI